MESRYFTGRDSALDELKQRLFLKASTERLALFGLGGIGKTQLALQLARWVKAHEPDRSIFWASALSVESFEQTCLQIAKKLQPHQDAENESAMELVHRELSDDDAGKWLFIVDNADDAELTFNELDRFFPVSEAGVTLLTTRSREVAISFAGRDILELQNMKAAEGIDFLTKILGNDVIDDPNSTSQLLEELNFLPLAIAQAAYYIRRNDGTIGRYLELMHKSEEERMRLVSREFHDTTRYRKMPNAVVKTWLISFKQIQNSDPPAADLLGFISCFEPKAIPKSILPSVGSEEEQEFAIGTLCGYGFLTKRGNAEMFDIHSLIHLSTRVWVAEAGITQQVIETVTQHMNHCFPSDDFPNRETWRAYLPHTKLILNGVELGCAEDRYSLLSKIGMCLQADGRSRDAVTAMKNACTWYESQHEQEHPSRLRSQHDLASAYLDNRQIKQGLELLVHVVALRERLLDEDHHDLLASQHELARAYLKNGQTKQAIELFEHVFAKHEMLDEEHPNRLVAQHSLAKVYLNNGQTKEAIELFEHVVAIEGRILDEEDSSRLWSQHDLARAYLDNGQTKQAIELFEHVVAKQEMYDEEDPNRLAAQHSLAWVYSNNGQTKQAIELFEHVVAIWGEILDEEDPSRLLYQHSLARAYLKNGQTKEAIELFERVVAKKEMLDEEDPSRLLSQHSLARAYLKNGQTKEAIELFEHVVLVEGRILDEEDPNRLISQHSLAQAYAVNGQTRQALELIKHVVSVEERTLDAEHPDRIKSQKLLEEIEEGVRKPESLEDAPVS
ncbi:unnamed protein product [Penicillium olsonii]|nr:unnamed protein product [Penicillium olsonii]